MKKTERIIVIILLTVIGTCMHFVCHLPGFTHWMGNIFPVNECVWEHMKMVFYPLLLLAIYLSIRQRDVRAFGGPILVAIPAMLAQIGLFFCCWPFFHHSVLILDIIIYTTVMVLALIWGERMSRVAWVRKTWWLWVLVAVALICALGYLTWNAPDWFIFTYTE